MFPDPDVLNAVITFTVCFCIIISYVLARNLPKLFSTHECGLLRDLPSPILVVNKETNDVILANQQACDLFEVAREKIETLNLKHLVQEYNPLLLDKVKEHAHADNCECDHYCTNCLPFKCSIQTYQNEEIPVEVSISEILYNGEIHIVIVLRDLTVELENEQQLARLTRYDDLTNIPNRTYLNAKAEQALAHAQNKEQGFAMFFIDVDNFKKVNGIYGYFGGDLLLRQVAKRLDQVVKEHFERGSPRSKTNRWNCFAARLSGDEFMILFENIASRQEASEAGKLVQERLSHPFLIDGENVKVNFSLGASLYPQDGTTITTLLRAADVALQNAKSRGKNRMCFHNRSMDVEAAQYFQYEKTIQYFIDSLDFNIAFQPTFRIDGELRGAEVLFRANTTQFPDIRYDKMISVAEQTDTIIGLGAAILQKACEAGAELNKRHDLLISVNASVKEVNDPLFVDNIKRALDHSGLPPNRLALEVTESLIVTNYAKHSKTLQYLRDMGVRISIDDFGKGYSSMAHLRYLPADKLKIDKSFIDEIVHDEKTREIVKGIISMAHILGLVVIAEGVETEEQRHILEKLNIDQLQGFLFSKALPQQEFIDKYLQEYTVDL